MIPAILLMLSMCQEPLFKPTVPATPAPAAVPTIPVVTIATADWCTVCHQWQADASSANQQVAKRWIAIDKARPEYIPPGEWGAVRDHIAANGGMVPATWWYDSSGRLQVLQGRHTDAQILDSMQRAEERAKQRRGR